MFVHRLAMRRQMKTLGTVTLSAFLNATLWERSHGAA